MSRQSVIRIKCEIVIPYEQKAFGEAAKAETKCSAIYEAVFAVCKAQNVTQPVWIAEHTSVKK